MLLVRLTLPLRSTAIGDKSRCGSGYSKPLVAFVSFATLTQVVL